MTWLFASGHVIDAILVLVVGEALALVLWRGRRVQLRPLLFNLASGAALMLAVRAALTGAAWWMVAACLLASFLAHGTELGLRLRSAAGACDACGKPPTRTGGTMPETVAFPSHELI
ncbi:hypothetical protein [Methylobacterium sp. J-090]|uniref:hypothetical protein n=1 Tax=Methylobacterium sp. J-090 TaxID=2836666 RepID=UPI001FB8CE9E|nr:hypothetical protein [Methylobacterium sp. J-090]MCJ2081563.1 hypothetical protein [Methylobacterium sp. J-090]